MVLADFCTPQKCWLLADCRTFLCKLNLSFITSPTAAVFVKIMKYLSIGSILDVLFTSDSFSFRVCSVHELPPALHRLCAGSEPLNLILGQESVLAYKTGQCELRQFVLQIWIWNIPSDVFRSAPQKTENMISQQVKLHSSGLQPRGERHCRCIIYWARSLCTCKRKYDRR